MKAVFVILAGIAVLLPTQVDAQNRFLGDNESGFGIAAGVGTSEFTTDLGGTLYYTFNGRVDLGLGIAHSSFDEDFGGDMSALQLSPTVTVAMIRPTPDMGLGLEANAGYSRGMFSGDALDQSDISMTANQFHGGVDGYWRINASERVKVLPGMGLSYVNTSLSITDNSTDQSASESTGDVMVRAQVSVQMNNQFYFTPSFSTIDGEETWAFSLGTVFPMGN